MEVDVIDDADESVNQQADGCCKKTLLKRGQERVKVHVGTLHRRGYWGQVYIFGVRTVYIDGVRTAVLTEKRSSDIRHNRNHIW